MHLGIFEIPMCDIQSAKDVIAEKYARKSSGCGKEEIDSLFLSPL